MLGPIGLGYDRSNDRVRVDAGQVRARVVGEGGNLGFTQRARLEYWAAGGLINTDANSILRSPDLNLTSAPGPHGFIDGTIEHRSDGASCAVVRLTSRPNCRM